MNPDPNSSDPAVVINIDLGKIVGDLLKTPIPKDPEERAKFFADRNAAREMRKKERERQWERERAEAYEVKNGINTWAGDKWWEREMDAIGLIEYRTGRELIEKARFEALVEKERGRYREREERKKR